MCKNCGANLLVEEGSLVAKCPYCGTEQTVPRLDSDKKQNLYKRADHFRRNNDFDRAMSLYEQVLAEDSTDAESYWSIVLCRYGIEYVENRETKRLVPTVHRTQQSSILEDEDYLSALEYADARQREFYEEEAARIDEMQKNILMVSRNTEPYDVFICYKETDDKTKAKTKDSVYAFDIYNALEKEGLRVFFSKVTLKNKPGIEYEPYIFGALQTAKVMIVVGTEQVYFNAPWVKNEWSRFKRLMADDPSKVLMTAYADIDLMDIPRELQESPSGLKLQAVDMSALGYLQNLVYGVKTIVRGAGGKREEPARAGSSFMRPEIAGLHKRMFQFLEDGEFDKAAEYSDRILDMDPENAEAYLGQWLASLGLHHREDLGNLDSSAAFDNNKYLKKIQRYASPELKEEITGYLRSVLKRVLSRHCAECMSLHDKAVRRAGARIAKDQPLFAVTFDEFMADFDGVIAKIEQLPEKLDERAKLLEAVNADSERLANQYAEFCYSRLLRSVVDNPGSDFFEDLKPQIRSAEEFVSACAKRFGNDALQKNYCEAIYNAASESRDNALNQADLKAKEASLAVSVFLFGMVTDYKNASEEFDRVRAELEAVRGDIEADRDRMLEEQFKEAKGLYDNGDFDRALVIFRQLQAEQYKGSDRWIENCQKAKLEQRFREARKKYDDTEYQAASEIFRELEDYNGSHLWVEICAKAMETVPIRKQIRMHPFAGYGKQRKSLAKARNRKLFGLTLIGVLLAIPPLLWLWFGSYASHEAVFDDGPFYLFWFAVMIAGVIVGIKKERPFLWVFAPVALVLLFVGGLNENTKNFHLMDTLICGPPVIVLLSLCLGGPMRKCRENFEAADKELAGKEDELKRLFDRRDKIDEEIHQLWQQAGRYASLQTLEEVKGMSTVLSDMLARQKEEE